jgi:hypothetical protein
MDNRKCDDNCKEEVGEKQPSLAKCEVTSARKQKNGDTAHIKRVIYSRQYTRVNSAIIMDGLLKLIFELSNRNLMYVCAAARAEAGIHCLHDVNEHRPKYYRPINYVIKLKFCYRIMMNF